MRIIGNMPNIDIRILQTIEELTEVVEVQATFWRETRTVIQRNMLLSLARNGGAIMGAYHDGRMIGFIMGYLGLEHPPSGRPARDHLKFVSQRMAVLPDYRHQGIGYQLKLAQRQYARQLDVPLITWTFDPLLSRNAHFNLHKLGSISRQYIVDYYGADSPVALAGSTDRWLVEWWVGSEHVSQRLGGMKSSAADYLANARYIHPLEQDRTALLEHVEILLIEIPYDYEQIVADNPAQAQRWRQHSRRLFQLCLQAGYVVVDYIREHERGFYVLRHTPPVLYSRND